MNKKDNIILHILSYIAVLFIGMALGARYIFPFIFALSRLLLFIGTMVIIVLIAILMLRIILKQNKEGKENNNEEE